MKTQLVNRLSKKYLLPNLPFFKSNGRLIYQEDLTYLLKGFYYENSAFDQELFTLEVFVQPLFIPVSYLTFNYGNRLGYLSKGRDFWWEYDESREVELMTEILSMISSHGVPFLEERNNLYKFINKYGRIDFGDNPNKIEGICYTYLLLEDHTNARRMLSSFNRFLTGEIVKGSKVAWMVEMNERVQLILNLIESQNFSGAIDQLTQWRSYTLGKLRISDE